MRRLRPICAAHEPSGDYVQKPQRIDFAEVTRGWVFGAGPSLTQARPEETVQLHSLGCLASPFKREACRRGGGKTLCRFQLLVVGWSGDAQENQNGTIQRHHILVSKAADTPADLCLRNGRDLIHHQSADSAQAVILARLDRQPKQRSIGWVGSECAHRD